MINTCRRHKNDPCKGYPALWLDGAGTWTRKCYKQHCGGFSHQREMAPVMLRRTRIIMCLRVSLQVNGLCTATVASDESSRASLQESRSDAASAAPATSSEPTSEPTQSKGSASLQASSEPLAAAAEAGSVAAGPDPAPSSAQEASVPEAQQQNDPKQRRAQRSAAATSHSDARDAPKQSKLDEAAVYLAIRPKAGCLQHVLPSDVVNFLQLPGLRRSDVRWAYTAAAVPDHGAAHSSLQLVLLHTASVLHDHMGHDHMLT